MPDSDIYAWLAEASLRGTPLKELLTGFCAELNALGLAIDRVTIATAALDPSIRAQALTWERESGALGEPILISGALAELIGAKEKRLRPLGPQALRGLDGRMAVFGLTAAPPSAS